MKRLLVLTMSIGAALARGTVLFYGGDFDYRNAGSCQEGGAVSDSRVYDNFMLSSPATITDVFGDFLDSSAGGGTSAYWDIRSGVSEGVGGTVVAGGFVSPATMRLFGRNYFGIAERRYDVAVSGVTLSANTMYWLTVAPDLSGLAGDTFLTTTSGANGVGGPLGDGNSFWDSTTFNKNMTGTTNMLGAGTWDFSLGVNGSPVPEPASLAILGIGAIALIRRQSK
jgi:hypothetical protein